MAGEILSPRSIFHRPPLASNWTEVRRPRRAPFAPSGIPGERITSTSRTPARNRQVGGVPDSYHLKGMARDSVPPAGMSLQEYYRRLKAANPGLQVLLEKDHVHMEPRG